MPLHLIKSCSALSHAFTYLVESYLASSCTFTSNWVLFGFELHLYVSSWVCSASSHAFTFDIKPLLSSWVFFHIRVVPIQLSLVRLRAAPLHPVESCLASSHAFTSNWVLFGFELCLYVSSWVCLASSCASTSSWVLFGFKTRLSILVCSAPSHAFAFQLSHVRLRAAPSRVLFGFEPHFYIQLSLVRLWVVPLHF